MDASSVHPAPSGFLSWLRRRTRLLVLVVLVLVAYMGALNRAQSLPWFIAAMLSATLVVGLAWPHWLVGRLSVTRRGPDRAEEGESITFNVDVRNHGVLPRFMVELVDHVPFFGAARGAPQGGASTLGMVGYVPGKSVRSFAMPLVCEKRGFYWLGPVGLASSFPLGLAEARQQRDKSRHGLTIYPAVFPIVDLPLRGAPSQIHRGGFLLPEGAGSAEFSGLREYRAGDSPRHIHWPTTARMNELMVKQFEPLASACVYIALDLAAGSNVGQGREATLEYALRIAASIARFTCHNNIRTRVLGTGANTVEVDVGSGAIQYQRILDELAVVDADGDRPYASVLDEVATRAIDGETVVVFLSQPAGEAAATINALAALRARRVHLFGVVLERSSFTDGAAPRDVQAEAATAALQELDARCWRVRRGDDLVHLFNS
jgi:uncharacterized protein (DUF58 family)